jgi:hypothetical protein
MLYSILAYHEEKLITALTPEEDSTLMEGLHKVHGRLTEDGQLGPAARLGATAEAVTRLPAIWAGPIRPPYTRFGRSRSTCPAFRFR